MEQLNDGYHSLFNGKVFDRGQAYYDAGKVDAPMEIAEGLWHAVVRGEEEYQVDVRLRHGKVVSAACTCPYAQRVTYCKHVAGVLIAMDERSRPGTLPTSAASPLVGMYAIETFPAWRGFGETEWRMVRSLLERLFCLSDLGKLLLHDELTILGDLAHAEKDDIPTGESAHDREVRRRKARRAHDNDFEPRSHTMAEEHASTRRRRDKDWEADVALANMRLMVPFVRPARLDELPHTWMTFLEAAYEHLKDVEGLRRLYAYYILIAQTYPEAVYVERLRYISGEHWEEDRDLIVSLCEKQRRGLMWPAVNPAYERLLREDRLADAAMKYTRLKSPDVMVRMLDVIALDPQHAQEALRRLCEVLQDPDSVLYESDDARSAKRVGRWIRKIEAVYGFEQAAACSEDIISMFPHRSELRAELSEYLRTVDERTRDSTSDEGTSDANHPDETEADGTMMNETTADEAAPVDGASDDGAPDETAGAGEGQSDEMPRQEEPER
ncbi:SWIM zinc finger family protein [Bifidobacterium saguinibicoloris]|uniref:SWIM zinc finger family protein n=2 Tax=Bifidobacterium TaxID=1678 RepID=UPI001F4893A1|nr:SWIM zinc finger family protein [Bifidobacterium saguinibicoloris]